MMLFVVLDLGNVKIGAACGIAPTLRTEREEWGTHFVGCVRVIERLGHRAGAANAEWFGSKESIESVGTHTIGSVVPALAQNARTGHPLSRNGKRRRIRSVGHPSGFALQTTGTSITVTAQ